MSTIRSLFTVLARKLLHVLRSLHQSTQERRAYQSAVLAALEELVRHSDESGRYKDRDILHKLEAIERRLSDGR